MAFGDKAPGAAAVKRAVVYLDLALFEMLAEHLAPTGLGAFLGLLIGTGGIAGEIDGDRIFSEYGKRNRIDRINRTLTGKSKG